MRTIETKVYTFDELSDRAKDTARDWYRQRTVEDFADFSADSVIEDAARMADILGINLRTRPVKLMGGGTRMEPNIYWSIGNRSDDGVTFNGSYSWRKGSVRKMASEAPAEWTNKETGEHHTNDGNRELNRIAEALADVQRRNFYQLSASISHGRSLYAGIQVEVERDSRNYQNVSAEDCETVKEALQDFASWIHRQLEKEYEYRMSDEAVDEDIRANDYEFDEDGNRA